LDRYNNLYIADTGNARVRKVTASTGIINTVAGNGVQGYSGDGGAATSASLQNLWDISIGPDGSLYITSVGAPATVRKVTNGIINRWAGTLDHSMGCFGGGDCVYPGSTTKARNLDMESPPAPAFYGSGSAFIGNDNSLVMVVPPNQILTWLVNAGPNGDGTGGGQSGYSGDGGPALKAMIHISPSALATDPSGNLYIVDQGNFRIRKVWLH
jgi:hypothetical protein